MITEDLINYKLQAMGDIYPLNIEFDIDLINKELKLFHSSWRDYFF